MPCTACKLTYDHRRAGRAWGLLCLPLLTSSSGGTWAQQALVRAEALQH